MNKKLLNEDSYIVSLDGLRFILATSIIVHHLHPAKAWFLVYSVGFFFTMSGFLITNNLKIYLLSKNKGLLRFYLRRSLRILPIYYFVLIIQNALFKIEFIEWKATFTFNYKIFLGSLTPQDPTITTYTSRLYENGIHFWSLCVEEQFYLIYPLFLLLIPEKRVPFAIILLLLFSIVSREFLNYFVPTSHFGALSFISGEYILWGCLTSYIIGQPNVEKLFSNQCTIPICLFIFLFITYCETLLRLPHKGLFNPNEFQSIYAIIFSVVLANLYLNRISFVSKILSNKLMTNLGKISYGAYLFHLIAIVLSRKYFESAPSKLISTLSLSFGFAFITWNLFEKKLLSFKEEFGFKK